MSTRERRNRKDRRAAMWDRRLRAWRCTVCTGKITHAQIRAGAAQRLDLTGAPRAFGWVHVTCPGA